MACGEWFDGNDEYPRFWEDRARIENLVKANGSTWNWDPVDANKKSRFPYVHKRLDVNDPIERAEAYDWLIEMSWLFKRVFG